MRKFLSFLLFILVFVGWSTIACAQNELRLLIIDQATGEKLAGVVVSMKENEKAGGVSDINGLVTIKNIPDGKQQFKVHSTGYITKDLLFTFPLKSDEIQAVSLAQQVSDIEEVIVSSTRTNARIEDIAIRVEILGQEEMQEENLIKPGNISSLLGDISIIHIQQTSSVTGNASVRMQGLDGKYTQLLRDGLPLYEGFSGNLGILQIPPLNLKQVEIVKGSVSTLYGGGAIAGLINLISKVPTDTNETTFTLNYTSLEEKNFNTFLSRKYKKSGFTFFAGLTHQNAVDIDNGGFSVVPELQFITIHPRFFYNFTPRSKLVVGYSGLIEKRAGGDMEVINHGADAFHSFIETNTSVRNTVDAIFDHEFSKASLFTFKATGSLFDRNTNVSGYVFNGRQVAAFSEASYMLKVKRHKLIFGLNHTGDYFNIVKTDSTKITDYVYNTFGVFVQDGWDITDKFTLETGFRTDVHNKFGTFYLPRIALLYRFTNTLSARLSGGMGYKTPNVFTGQSYPGIIKYLLPVGNDVKAETSTGFNLDLNYRFLLFDKISVQLNQAFYWTQIGYPVVLTSSTNNYLLLSNNSSSISSSGTDTYLRIKYDEIELYFGYNHTIAIDGIGTDVYVPFSPQDKFSNTIVFELNDKWKIGLEDSWVGNQYIGYNPVMQNIKARDYWFLAAMIGRQIGKHVNLVLNCENILDFRQTKYEKIVLGPLSDPYFKPLWGPIDGRVLNIAMGIKL